LVLLQFLQPRAGHVAVESIAEAIDERLQDRDTRGVLRHGPRLARFAWYGGDSRHRHRRGRGDELEAAFDRRRRHPWLLRVAGRLHHRKADLVEGLEDIESRFADGLRQGLGIGAVAAEAIERNVSGLRRVGNQRAFRRPHLGEPALSGAQPAPAERIVAAGIEEYHVEFGAGTLHGGKNQGRVHHLEQHVGFAGRIGVHRHQVIGAVHLDAVTGVIEQRDVGSHQLIAEFLQDAVEGGLVEIDLCAVADQREAEAAQRFRHQLGVVLRIIEPRHVLIAGVTDNECNPRVGECRRGNTCHAEDHGGDKSCQPFNRMTHRVSPLA
jgi:hypothetical protein